jgi:ribosomal protein S18 acetylase RimI-like enzyme
MDPVERWLFPEAVEYLTHFPRFVAAFAGEAFAGNTAWTLDEFAAVAVWLAPGSEPDVEPVITALTETVSERQHDHLFSVLDQMNAAHPREPHWYLPWLGVDCARQGLGLGGRLLKQCLATVDSEGLPAFLETPNPLTIPFYERHGFTVTSVAQAGDCPPVTSMLRPRS